MGGLTISGGIKRLSVVCVQDYWLSYIGEGNRKGKSLYLNPCLCSMVTVLITIFFVKNFTIVKRGLAQWH